MIPVYKDGKWGFVSKTGKVIRPEYDTVSVFNEGISAVQMEGVWYLLDKKGKIKARIK